MRGSSRHWQITLGNNSMSQPSAERNLLFGILAFQLNFIDRSALLVAFDRWSRTRRNR